jgi:hypothetical protein
MDAIAKDEEAHGTCPRGGLSNSAPHTGSMDGIGESVNAARQ